MPFQLKIKQPLSNTLYLINHFSHHILCEIRRGSCRNEVHEVARQGQEKSIII